MVSMPCCCLGLQDVLAAACHNLVAVIQEQACTMQQALSSTPGSAQQQQVLPAAMYHVELLLLVWKDWLLLGGAQVNRSAASENAPAVGNCAVQAVADLVLVLVRTSTALPTAFQISNVASGSGDSFSTMRRIIAEHPWMDVISVGSQQQRAWCQVAEFATAITAAVGGGCVACTGAGFTQCGRAAAAESCVCSTAHNQPAENEAAAVVSAAWLRAAAAGSGCASK